MSALEKKIKQMGSIKKRIEEIKTLIVKYEASIKNESVSQPKVQTQTVTPKLNEWGKDRYSNLNKFIKK